MTAGTSSARASFTAALSSSEVDDDCVGGEAAADAEE
jgi:hypothetical protein